MFITSDKREKLAQKLFDKMIELKKEKERNIKTYEVAFQDVIEEVFPDECWWDVTSCEIFMHLMEHKDPEATVIAILQGLKEGENYDDK
jgi:hypothetical protein